MTSRDGCSLNPVLALNDLLDSYDRQHRSRSRGGLRAISGFAFQIHTYLADFATALAKGHPTHLEEGGAALFEAFSDYVKEDSGAVVCVQAKLALSLDSLVGAAEEFLDIDSFLGRVPTLRSAVQFEVVGSRGDPPSDDCWGDVIECGRRRGWSRDQLDQLETLRRANRLLPPRVEADPWWRLISTVFHILGDPFGFAYEATSLCLDRGGTPEGASRIRDEIARLFKKNLPPWDRLDRRPSFGRVMLPKQFTPLSDPSNEIVIGQIPTVENLQDGRFMDREDCVKEALLALDKVLVERQRARSPAVYTFWIDGRSGCGKSVLLLQLMRSLVQERDARAVWLGDGSRNLLGFLRCWFGGQETSPRPGWRPDGEPIFIFIDDFYAPHKREDLRLIDIGDIVRHSGRSDWPVLVTCGPPEQHESLTYDYGDCCLRVKAWRLPLVNSEEGDWLHSWFTARTGRKPRKGLAFDSSGGLMVSMVFEMGRGDLREFALRFKRRLESVGLQTAILPVLALNRLYLWAPVEFLAETDLEALRGINRDQDFTLPADGTREPLRLTHPHLSDAIYQVLRPQAEPLLWVRDLVCAFQLALRHAPTVACQVLSVVVEGRERLDAVPPEVLVLGLARVWAADPDAPARFSDGERAWVWVYWVRMLRRHPGIRAFVFDAPARAIQALREQPQHADWPALWSHLLYSSESGTWTGEAGKSVAELSRPELMRMGNDWKVKWGKSEEYDLEPSVPELLVPGYEWLMSHPDSVSWHAVWRALLGHQHLTASDLLSSALGSFNWQEDVGDGAWSTPGKRHDLVATELSVPALLRLGYEWLREQTDSDLWFSVWRDLLNCGDLHAGGLTASILLRLGHDWLRGHETSCLWRHIWWGLLTHSGLGTADLTVCALLRLGCDWLERQENSPLWRVLWHDLIGHDGLDTAGLAPSDLLRLAYEWLGRHEDSSAWRYVWGDLLAHGDLDDAGLLGPVLHCGYDWLQAHEDAIPWDGVWLTLLHHDGLASANLSVPVLRLGYAWLSGHEDSDSWDEVWRDLLTRGDLEGMDLSVLARLPGNFIERDLAVFDLSPLRHQRLEEVQAPSRSVATAETSSPSWPSVFLALVPQLSSDSAGLATLTDLARAWLIHPANQYHWDRPRIETALASVEAAGAADEPLVTR